MCFKRGIINTMYHKVFRYHRERAGCVPFRRSPKTHEIEICMIETMNPIKAKNPHHFVVPAGGVEHRENVEDAALRETREEAGLIGKSLGLIGVYIFEEKRTRTHMYLMEVEEELDPQDYEEGRKGRRRRWYSVAEAIQMIKRRDCQLGALSTAINMIHKMRKNSTHSAPDLLALVDGSKSKKGGKNAKSKFDKKTK